MAAQAATEHNQAPSASTPIINNAPGAPGGVSKASKKKKKAKSASPDAESSTPKAESSDAVKVEESVAAASAPVMSRSESTSEAAVTAKGPLEEFVTKRVRVLSKKIQKLKSYQQQPRESLNPDQISALTSLPMLEGAAKELDEVSKTVELVELEQAAKVREQRAENEKEIESRVQTAIGDYETSLIQPLVLFVTLQGLVNPPRTSRTNKFDPLNLPEYLRDHVDLSDAQLIGELWHRFIIGGETARHALRVIKGESTEDGHFSRVNELMQILAAPAPTATAATEAMPQESEAPVAEADHPVAPVHANGGGMFNFLQEDELQADTPPEPERTVETEAPVDVVIPEETPAPGPVAQDEETKPAPETPTESTAAPTAATSVAHWADEDDEVDLDMLRGAFGNATSAAPATPAPEPVQAVKPAEATSSKAPDATPVSADEPKRQPAKRQNRKPNGKGPRSPTEPTSGESKDRAHTPKPRQRPNGTSAPASTPGAKPAQLSNGHPRQPSMRVDDDGFEAVIKRRPSAVSNSAGRGRGGPRNGSSGGRQGRPDGQGTGPKRDSPRAAAEAQPKSSIYKA